MRNGNVAYLLLGAVVVAGIAAAAIVLPQRGTEPVNEAKTNESPSDVAVSPTQEKPKMITSKFAESKSGRVEKAVFGAGCFWGVEAAFRRTPGVLSTTVGYAGGAVVNPTYEQVCTDTTGHAEVVQVEFDPGQITFEQLLEVFWTNHNPTQLNRQGPDFGKQYRSVVFYVDDAQRATAEASKERLAASGKFSKPVVTQIAPLTTFYAGEEYHQQYLEKRGLSHCHL
jgi:peptide-methionine (S)-S-oxide reductase